MKKGGAKRLAKKQSGRFAKANQKGGGEVLGREPNYYPGVANRASARQLEKKRKRGKSFEPPRLG